MKSMRLSLTIFFSFILILSVSFSPSCESVAPINVNILGDDSYEYEIIEGPAQVILDGSNLATYAGPSDWKWIIRVNAGDDDWKTYSVGSGEMLTEYLSPGNYSITLFVTYDDFNDVDIFTADLAINAGPNYFDDDDDYMDDDHDDDYNDDDEDDDDDENNDDYEIDDNDDGDEDEDEDDNDDDKNDEIDNDDEEDDDDDDDDDQDENGDNNDNELDDNENDDNDDDDDEKEDNNDDDEDDDD